MRSWKDIMSDNRLDDEGTYDYLVEELPENHSTKYFSWEKVRCESCGKRRHFYVVHYSYFYCWDGYDYMDYTECQRCILRGHLNPKRLFKSIKNKIWLWRKDYEWNRSHKKHGKKSAAR